MPKDKAISDQAFSSIQRKISNRGASHYNLICLAKTHYFYFNDNYINPFKGILLHTRPCACAPILNNFHRNSRIVRTHGRHSIVFDMVNNWFFVENVCLHHVEHFLEACCTSDDTNQCPGRYLALMLERKGGKLRSQFLPTLAPYLLLFALQVGARRNP